jgi:hypothetical protein
VALVPVSDRALTDQLGFLQKHLHTSLRVI